MPQWRNFAQSGHTVRNVIFGDSLISGVCTNSSRSFQEKKHANR
jgi:hypothetical protein